MHNLFFRSKNFENELLQEAQNKRTFYELFSCYPRRVSKSLLYFSQEYILLDTRRSREIRLGLNNFLPYKNIQDEIVSYLSEVTEVRKKNLNHEINTFCMVWTEINFFDGRKEWTHMLCHKYQYANVMFDYILLLQGSSCDYRLNIVFEMLNIWDNPPSIWIESNDSILGDDMLLWKRPVI